MAISETKEVVGLDGKLLDCRFLVEHDQEISVVVESRGGTVAAGNARNLDYAEGLSTLLSRLRRAEALITDAVVDSATTQSMGLSTRHLFPWHLLHRLTTTRCVQSGKHQACHRYLRAEPLEQEIEQNERKKGPSPSGSRCRAYCLAYSLYFSARYSRPSS